MKLYTPHRWDLPYAKALEVQKKLRGRVRLRPRPLRSIRHVAGADIAISKRLGLGIGAVVVFTYPGLEIVETVFANLEPWTLK